jgi:F-type H+-transporting ATPase subunit a
VYFCADFKMTLESRVMQTKRFGLLVLMFFFLMSPSMMASNSHGESTELTIKEQIKKDIDHHLKDSHSFHLWGDHEKGTAVGFPLPVILLVDWSQLHVFSSSEFHHGSGLVESKGLYFKEYHSKIYITDSEGHISYDENHEFVANTRPIDFSITKNVFSLILISALIFWIFSTVARNYKKDAVPRGMSKIFEPLVIFVRDEIAIPNIGEKHYRKYMNYLLTVFFFIWMINIFGQTPLGINITGNIAITFALALMTFLITTFTANKNYWGHIFWMPGVPYLMRVVLAPIELLGIIIKPFALLIRLYANISAGHVVIMSIIGLLFVFENWFARGAFLGLGLFLSVIELLVAFLQAYIFTMLSALYFGSAVEEHDDH